MPPVIAAALVAAIPATAAAIIGTVTIADVIAYSVVLAGSVLAARLLQPKQQTPSAVQTQFPVRQALPPRIRSYWRVKVAGALGFEQVDGGGSLWTVSLIGNGQIAGIDEHWLGDDQMLVDPGTTLIASTYGGSSSGGGDFGEPEHNYAAEHAPVQIIPFLGLADQVNLPALIQPFFNDFSLTAYWRGVPHVVCKFAVPNLGSSQASQNAAASLFPYGPPAYRAAARGALVYDPRAPGQVADGDPDRPNDNNWTVSGCAGLVILDFLRHPDGWAKKSSSGARAMAPIALFNVASFIAFADTSDQGVPVKGAGGATVPRYLLAGSYDMGNTAPKDILEGMKTACDAEFYRDGNGLIGIRGGAFGPDPEVIFASSAILEYDLKPGAGVFSAVNRLNGKFSWARADYGLIDMWPWDDTADIAQRGELLTDSLDLSWCPTNSQARRIAKIQMAKRNPAWSGTVVCNATGLLAFGERLIAFAIPELGIDSSLAFLLLGFEPSPTLERVKLTVAALDPAAYDWDAESEEGPLPTVGSSIPDPAIPALVPWPVIPGGGGPFVNAVLTLSDDGLTWTAVVTWDNISFITLFYECEYNTDSINWIDVPVPDIDGQSVLSVTIAGIPAGPSFFHQFRVRSVTPTGKASQWSQGVISFTNSSWSDDWSNDFGPQPI